MYCCIDVVSVILSRVFFTMFSNIIYIHLVVRNLFEISADSQKWKGSQRTSTSIHGKPMFRPLADDGLKGRVECSYVMKSIT